MRRKVQLSPARRCGASTAVVSYSPRRGPAHAASARAPPAERNRLRSMVLSDRPLRVRRSSRSRRADVIALRQLDAVVAQDVVRRRDVEVEVRQGMSEQVLDAAVVHFAWAEL